MKVLVTGASGFLGGRVTKLLAEQHKVLGTGRTFSTERRAALESLGVRLLPADLTRPQDLPALLDGVDAVVHCAALSTLWGRWEDLRRTNVDASARLAAACAQRGIRLVYIGSPSIYNRAVHDDPTWGTAARPVPESLRVGPRFDSDYAKSKWFAELAVSRSYPAACILRPRGLYGPGDASIMPRVIAALQAGRLPRLVDGDVLTDLTHVDNAAHAVRLAVESDISGPVNIADGDPIAVWASIDQVADALGVARPGRRMAARPVELVAAGTEQVARILRRGEPRLTATGIRLLTRGLRLDLTRARTELGYRPIFTGGLASTLSAMLPGVEPPGRRHPVVSSTRPATPASTTTLAVEQLQAGWCVSIGALAQRGELWRRKRFPAGVTLIQHPEHGLVLFDTGYSRAAVEAVRHWPAWPYGTLLPVRLPAGQTLAEQLARRGVAADSVRAIICSHLHMDHLAGAADFPHAPVWLDQPEIEALTSFGGLTAVRHGIVPAIVPDAGRLRPFAFSDAPHWLAPFTQAMDFFADGSLWIVPSPGHTGGSVSAVARTGEETGDGAGLVLLAGDVAWSERALREGIEPHWLTRRVVFHDLAAARRTGGFWRSWLARHPAAEVVVSHDAPTTGTDRC